MAQGTAPKPPASLNRAFDAASELRLRRAQEAEEDRALIDQARAGNAVAFRKLVERHQRRAYAVAFGILRNDAESLEVVQEAFIRAYKNLATFQGDSAFFTWLYRIVANLSIDQKRRPGRRVAELDPGRHDLAEDNEAADFPLLAKVDGADPEHSVRRQELRERLREAIDALPSYHRDVIVMREIEGMSYEEMAAAAQVSKGTIMSRLFHARQKLQRALVECYKEHVGRAPPESAGERDDAAAAGDGNR
jgi:RNA polymerase sigma-70 factor (ECF subfamily)